MTDMWPVEDLEGTMSDDKWTDYFFRILNGLSVLFFLSSVGLFVTVAWLAVVGR